MNWWESAPLANSVNENPPQGGNWWESAPLANAAPAPQQSVSPVQSFAAGAGDSMLFGQGPEIAGFSEYTSNLGAPGSYDRGKRQYLEHMRVAQGNPDAFRYGGYTGMAATAPMMGGVARVGLAGAARSVPYIASGMEKGGKLAEVLAEPSAVVHGSKHIEMAMKYGGRSARVGAEYLRGNRGAARELMIDALKEKFPKAWSDAQKEQAAADAAFTLAPEAQPPLAPQQSPAPPEITLTTPSGPGSGALSAEMRAALKRGKFRHDYSTGEWRDLLAPGE